MEHESICLEDTRVGLLQDILRWSKTPGDACIFWLNGMAGTGKSTIARTVARKWDDEKRLGASFFFSRGQGDLAHASKFFTTLAYQLAHTQSSLAAGIRSAICKHPNVPWKSLREQWKHLILEPLSQLNVVPSQLQSLIVVLDALDECNDGRDTELILKLLSQAKTLSAVRLLVFLTSRPETPIRYGFDDIPKATHQDFILHSISHSIVDLDISVFFRHEFDKIRKRRRLPREWPGEPNLHRLVQKADGLFIYAATVCRFIGYKDTVPQERLASVLRDSMEDQSSTKELDLIYTTVLRCAVVEGRDPEIQKILLKRFRRIVGSIFILSDTLTAGALADLLGDKQRDVEETLESLSSVLDYSENIRLLHPSFRDFLLDNQRCNDANFRIDRNDVHKYLAASCLKLLSIRLTTDLCFLMLPGTLTNEVDPYTLQCCLPQEVRYACRYWVDHLQRSNAKLQGKRVHNFLKERFRHWIDGQRNNIELSADEQLHNRVHTFLKEHFLHWFEALVLMGNVVDGILRLKTFNSMLTVSDVKMF